MAHITKSLSEIKCCTKNPKVVFFAACPGSTAAVRAMPGPVYRLRREPRLRSGSILKPASKAAARCSRRRSSSDASIGPEEAKCKYEKWIVLIRIAQPVSERWNEDLPGPLFLRDFNDFVREQVFPSIRSWRDAHSDLTQGGLPKDKWLLMTAANP